MADLPIPSFATWEKLSSWIASQASIFVQVLKSPTEVYFDQAKNADGALGRSIQFVAFVVLVTIIIMIPIDAVLYKVNVLDVGVFVTNTVALILSIIVFSFSCFGFSRLLGGKGALQDTLIAMFLSSAFLPIFYITKFMTRLDPVVREALLNREFGSVPYFNSPVTVVGMVVETAVLVFIIVRLIPLLKEIQKFGTIRSLIVILMTGAVDQIVSFLVWIPFWAEVVRKAAKS